MRRGPVLAEGRAGPVDQEGKVAKKGRDVALLPALGRLVQYVPTTQIRWFVVDDGGIYRPGDTVHVKGWIRAQGPEAHADLEHLPAKYGRTVSYFLSSESFADSLRPAGSHEKTRLARHGEFGFSVTLPSNVAAGSLSISMTLPGADPKLRGATHRHGIKIAEYERPEYEVEVETGAGPYLVGASSVATVRASYFGGGPLPNADTVWRVTAQPATYSPPGLDEYHFGPSELDFAVEPRKPIQGCRSALLPGRARLRPPRTARPSCRTGLYGHANLRSPGRPQGRHPAARR